jgi:hypothetical protein
MKSPKPEFGMSFQDAGSELAACTHAIRCRALPSEVNSCSVFEASDRSISLESSREFTPCGVGISPVRKGLGLGSGRIAAERPGDAWLRNGTRGAKFTPWRS